MLFPHVTGRRVALRPAAAADAKIVHDMKMLAGTGVVPLLDLFAATFTAGAAAAFVVTDRESGNDVAHTALLDFAPAGHVRVELVAPPGIEREAVADAAALTINFAFAMWPLQKVYWHATDHDLPAFGWSQTHAAMVRPQAVLAQHAYFHGRLWDVSVLAVSRDDWDIHGVDLVKQIV